MGIGRTCVSVALLVFFACAATEPSEAEKPSKSRRQGKALNISRKPCRDPNGKKGICTFKWDCINQNGSLLGTCMDGFVFGTCCHYSPNDISLFYDLNESVIEGNYVDNNLIGEEDESYKIVPTVLSMTATKPTTTTRNPPSNVTKSTSPQLITWTAIGPTATTTRRPFYNHINRPINVVPFPFPPGSMYNYLQQGAWPVGVAVPVDPYRPNLPLQYRPPYQSSQRPNVIKKPTLSGSFTILKGPDKNATALSTGQQDSSKNSSASKHTVEMTTVTVPIPQWTTSSSVPGSGTFFRPGQATYSVDRLPTLSPNLSYSFTTSAAPIVTMSSSGSNLVKYSTRPPPQLHSSESHLVSLANAAKPNLIVRGTTTPKPSKKHVLDYRKDCGVRSLVPKGRIVGGQNVHFGRWPWQVLVKEVAWLGLYQKNKCGGVLISAKHVLTAGHCQPGFLSSLIVVLGEYDLSANFEVLKPEMRRVKRMVVHRHYNPQNFDNDIAILELDPQVIFRPHISPICLPAKDRDFTGKMAYVTGWGKTSHGGTIPKILQEVQVPIVSNSKCLEMFKTAGHVKMIKDTFLCAGYTTGGKDSCEGDSGGPLMVQADDGRWVLVGTVSHGIRCADPNLPGVYMKTAAYRSWIDKNMNS